MATESVPRGPKALAVAGSFCKNATLIIIILVCINQWFIRDATYADARLPVMSCRLPFHDGEYRLCFRSGPVLCQIIFHSMTI